MKENKILIVEDEGVQAMHTKLSLLKMGYQVLPIAITGKSAINLAIQYKPDLILMDVRLRGKMDGIDAAGTIRQQMQVPIIFVTAFADKTTMDRAQQTQPHAFLQKPVEDMILQETINEALTP